MKRNFGFTPCDSLDRYGFISYKSEEYRRIAPYAKMLFDMGIPLWYDYGIPAGKWEETISEKIVGSSFVLLFVSNSIFESKFIKTEFKTASDCGIPIIAVFMEKIDKHQIKAESASFFAEINQLENKFYYTKDNQDTLLNQIAALLNYFLQNDSSYRFRKSVFSQARHNYNNGPALSYKNTLMIITASASVFILLLFFVFAFTFKDFLKSINSVYKNEESQIQYMSDIDSYRKIHVGDHVYFGKYEKDTAMSDKAENIEWVVLQKHDNAVLLVSVALIDCRPYDEYQSDTNWESCTLRKWMNNDFFSRAFDTSEQNRMIVPSTDSNVVGSGINDKVFLLSINDVQRFNLLDEFLSDSTRYAYAKWQFMQSNQIPVDFHGSWWLLDKANNYHAASCVSWEDKIFPENRIINKSGVDVNTNMYIRPVIWVRI